MEYILWKLWIITLYTCNYIILYINYKSTKVLSLKKRIPISTVAHPLSHNLLTESFIQETSKALIVSDTVLNTTNTKATSSSNDKRSDTRRALQLLSHVQLLATLRGVHIQASLYFMSPRVCSNACPLSQWCHPTISSSVAPFSSCPQSFPTSEFFPRVSSSHQVAKVLELQDPSFQWMFRFDLSQCKRHSGVFFNITIQKHQFFGAHLLYGPTHTSIHHYWKNHSFQSMDLCQQSDISAF